MCVLGWISRSHARNGNEIQTSGCRGSARKIEKLGLLIHVNPKHAWKSWNLACYHGAASTCCGKNFVSFGAGFGICFSQTGASHYKHHGSTENNEKLGFLILVISKHAWKSWNLAWCHDMAPTCCGNFFGRIGTSFGVSFLQTGASLKKARGSERERVTSVCETRYVHCLLPH